MVKTKKKHVLKKNNIKTRRFIKEQQISLPENKTCKVGLEPFEENFSKMFEKNKFKKYISSNKKDFAKLLLSRFSPKSIKPENDYYSYINYKWLQMNHLNKKQEYIVQVDDFRLTQDKVYRELNEIILEHIKTHDDKFTKNLKTCYDSIVKMTLKSESKKLAKDVVDLVNDYTNNKTVWELLGYINRDEMISSGAPFVWSVFNDLKDVKTNRSYINGHQFSLLDLAVYYDDGTYIEYKKKYRQEFFNYCKKLFYIVLGPNHYNEKDIFDVEVEIFNTMGQTDPENTNNVYNRVYSDEANTKYGFDWKSLSTAIGFKKPPEFFITSNLNYIKYGTELMLKNWKSPKWKTYWIWIFIRRIVRLTRGWEDLTFKFYGEFERGQKRIIHDNAVSAALYMSLPYNNFLLNKYIEKYSNAEILQFVQIMADDLKKVFQRILTNNKWLDPSTKKYALKKLKHFKFVYGRHPNIMEDPNIDYTDNLYDNMIKIMYWRTQTFIDLEGKTPIYMPMMDWTQYPVKMVGQQPYIVNASYTPTTNSIFINLGYMQKPFIDLNGRGVEYNLAQIGYTLCHEMSHGFDDMGSQYGIDGNLKDWWTEKDKAIYKKIQEDVIRQYEDFAAKDGIKFDASIGIGEDLADISGLAICEQYLRDFQEHTKSIIPVQYTSYQRFYTFFAIQQRQQVSKASLIAQLKTNPHPLNKYRCNVPLSRSSLFRTLYNVKHGDGMWWHNTNMIWSNKNI